MIYIIISNVGFALVTLWIYFRYSHFRISSAIKIRDLKKKIEDAAIEKEHLAQSMKAEVKNENDQVKKLLRDLETFRKEKENEMRLRLEAEKQIELALQKTGEVEKRLVDWKMIQDAAISDSKEAISKVGADLYQKMTKSYKDDSLESRATIERNMKNVYAHLETIAKDVEEFKKRSLVASDKISQAVSSVSSTITKAAPIQLDEFTKRKLNNVSSLIKDSGFIINKDYIIASGLDEQRLGMMLCDLIFAREQTIYFVDFKSIRYFEEYEKAKKTNKEAALAAICQRLDKYIAYVSNPKYSATIQKLAGEFKMKFSKIKVVIALASRDDMAVMKEIKYLEKAQKAKVDVMDVDAVGDLAL